MQRERGCWYNQGQEHKTMPCDQHEMNLTTLKDCLHLPTLKTCVEKIEGKPWKNLNFWIEYLSNFFYLFIYLLLSNLGRRGFVEIL